jgi:hypothetical protein
MKKTSFLFTIVILALLFLSCKKEKEVYYYCFTPLDYQKLLPYTEGQVLNFLNQNNEKRTFSVSTVNTEFKSLLTLGMGFFGDSEYFYYDHKGIGIIDSKSGHSFNINFQRYPLDYELAKEDIYAEYPSEFYGAIQYMRFWNGIDEERGLESSVSIDYEQNKIEMNVNGKTYKNVFVLTSGNDSIIEYPWPDGTILYKDVNVIYYDEIEGIIGFDDLNGNEWRLN